MTEEPNPVGRPTKYRPEMCEVIIEGGKEGMSVAELSCKIDIARDTWNEWKKSNPEFSVAVKRAEAYSQAWWEKQGRGGAVGLVNIQPVTWIFNMKNRFREDWRDKVENDHISSDGSMSPVGEIPAAERLATMLESIKPKGEDEKSG